MAITASLLRYTALESLIRVFQQPPLVIGRNSGAQMIKFFVKTKIRILST